MAALLRAYGGALQSHPVLTNSLSGATLFSAGDAVAQIIEQRHGQPHGTKQKEMRLDWPRVARQFVYGFVIAGPLFTTWYALLHRMTATFRTSYVVSSCGQMYHRSELVGAGYKRREVAVKVLFDQVLFTGAYLNIYLLCMTLMEGRTVSEGLLKCKEKLHDTWVRSILFWAPVQYVNFTFIPAHLTPVTVQCFCLIWLAFLSLYFHQEECTATVDEALVAAASARQLLHEDAAARTGLVDEVQDELAILKRMVVAQAAKIRVLEGAALDQKSVLPLSLMSITQGAEDCKPSVADTEGVQTPQRGSWIVLGGRAWSALELRPLAKVMVLCDDRFTE